MKTGSKRGAALAYVIVVSAALMILASALVFSAKFNLDSATDSLEGRQAYLDAKSAIEYGRAYVLRNPDTGDFTVLKTAEGPGFEIGPAGESNAIASYDNTDKLITASAKYRSSDRVRKLGYQFTTEEDEGSGGSGSVAHDFLVASNGYAGNEVFYPYNPTFSPNSTSVYPVVSHLPRQTSGNNVLTAPQIYLLGQNNGISITIYDGNQVTLKSDFIYIAGGIDCYKESQGPYRPLNLKTYSDKNQGIIYFGEDVKKDGDFIAEGGRYYSFKNNINLYDLKPGDLEEIEDGTLPDGINQDDVDFIVGNEENMITGDSWDNNRGSNWCGQGIITGLLKNRYNSGVGFVPPFVSYKKQIEDTNINPGELYRANPNSNHYNDDEQIVYWYLNDVGKWGNALLGNNNQNSDEYYLNISNIYYAKEINLLYVNAGTNFEIPEYKTVAFQSDSITLNVRHSDTEAGGGDSQPKITHSGSAARFILEAQDPGDAVRLRIPNTLQVEYKDQNGIVRKYQIKAGWYEVRQLNLFSDDAKDFFNDTEPIDDPSGGSGGGGGTEITGGVYTDGE
ncbi:hypothetical protein ACRQV7_04330 [Caproiciproducens sp. R2]|uniref:hypothetical protein n=1 Tax=Caproiciproducens sp. R2 TaxID=3435187 RepID=UPI0040349442